MSRESSLEERALVVGGRPLIPGLGEVILEAPRLARELRPGQFLMARVSPWQDPLLGRPLGVSAVRGSQITLMVAALGRGSRALLALRPGAEVTLRGPLGTPFPPPAQAPLVLAGGGFGVAPLMYAWDELRAGRGEVPTVVLGVPDGSWAPLERLVAHRVGKHLRVFSDDGSLGERGTPCDALEGAGEVWACGPLGMIRAMARCAPPGMRLLVNLDQRMGCGYGGCLGCTVPTVRGPVRACVEGPFFDARDVDWEALEEWEGRS